MLKNIAYEKRGGGRFCSRECGTRKFKLNERFFETIDTEEKAYWLGFLYADGSQNGKQFQIGLQIGDKNHLEKFAKSINCEHRVKEIKKSSHRKGIAANLQISSKLFCYHLEQQGCVRNKTFVTQYPKIPNHLDRHFIRGVFDGDGTIGIMNKKYGNKKATIYSASKLFAKSIAAVLVSNKVVCNLYKREYSDGRAPGFNVQIATKTGLFKLFSFFYTDATVCLQRKQNKF